MLNPAALGQLCRFQPAVRQRVLAAYFRDAPEVAAVVRSAIEHADPALLRSSAHRLKSSSATLGAERLAGVCAELERCGKNGELAAARPLLERLEAELPAVIGELTVWGAFSEAG